MKVLDLVLNVDCLLFFEFVIVFCVEHQKYLHLALVVVVFLLNILYLS